MDQVNAQKFAEKEDKFDFGMIYSKYKRFWWLFVASFAFCIAIALIYLSITPPVYSLVSKVLISQDDDASSKGASLVKNLGLGSSGAKVDDEILVMGSHGIHVQMVRDLGLNRTYFTKVGLLKKREYYNNSPIIVNAPNELFDTLSHSMVFKIKVNDKGDDINIKVVKGFFSTMAEVNAKSFPIVVKTPYGFFSVNKTSFYRPGESIKVVCYVKGNDMAAEGYDKEITSTLSSKKADGIELYHDDPNVKRGKDILNKIVELYNKRCQAEKDEAALNTGKFIDDRLSLIYNELSTSEADIENYKKNSGMVDLGAETTTLLGKKNMSENVLNQLETENSIMLMIRDFISDQRNNYSLIPFNADFSAASGVIDGYNKLILERMRIESTARGNNTVLKAMNDQIDALRSNVRKSVDQALASLRIKRNQAAAQENLSSSELGNVPTQEREFRQLYRQQSIKNELYTFLLQKREENALVLAATTPKGKIIDKAYAFSEPVAPKKAAVLFIAILLGLAIPFMILYIKHIFTTKFSTVDELGEIAKVPVLGEICHNRHHDTLIVREGKTYSIVELFRLVRNNIQFMLPGKDDKVLLVTSSISGEGKSFVSLNLAASFALLNKKVALVGMDIRDPKLAQYLSIKPSPGVTTYLAKEEISIDDIVQHSSDIDGLDIYVSGPIPPNPSELLLSKRTDQFISELRERYDYVIIDSAPIALVSDTFSLAKFSNVLVFVTRANYTKRNFVNYFNQAVKRGQFHNAAVILNDSNPRLSSGYGYGYGKDE